MKPKVSIIIPVFNGGAFMRPCLESLQKQTMQELEFILVLDCPTDGSDKVAEEFAAKDSRFVILRNAENSHIGYSRNQGLKAAQGEYIGFCDNDDYCAPDMFEKLYSRAKECDADVVLSNQCSRFQDKDELYPVPSQESFDVIEATHTIISTAVMKQNEQSYANIRSVWNQLFRAEFIQKHGLEFVDTRKVCNEDTMFCAEAYLQNPQVAILNETLYFWLQHKTSTLHSYSYTRSENVVNYINHLYDVLNKAGRVEEMKEALAECVVRKLYTAYRGELRTFGLLKGAKVFKTKIEGSKQLLEVLSLIKTCKFATIPPTKKIFYRLYLK